MAWDDIKSTLESRPDVPDDKKLTAAEWNAMTADQQDHSTRHEQGGSDELSVSGLAGVLADPQTPEQEAVEDIVAALTVGGTNVDVAYDDGAGTLTISTPALADQEVRDLIDTVVVGGTQVSTTYDGTNLTVDIDAPTQAEFDTHSGRHEDGGADELDVSNLGGVLADAQTPQTEAVQDIVGALVAGGTNVTVTYDDANDVLTVDTSALNTEEVEDAVGALVTAGNAITVNYDDGANTLSIGVDESALSFYDGTNLTAPVDNQSLSTENATVDNKATIGNELQIGNTPVPSETKTVADDAVATIDVSDASVIFCIVDQNAAAAFISAAFDSLFTMGIGNKASNQGTGSLSGTTGPDGSVNYGRDGNTFVIENRIGREKEIDVFRLDWSQ